MEKYFFLYKDNLNSMKILAFETSCDDTSIAIFENENLLAMETASQIKIHNLTWWVVPEVAAREHANSIFSVLEKVLQKAKVSLEEINYIWVTTNPWLIPSLLTWITVASTISTVLKIPIIEINHIEAHIFSNFLERKEEEIKFPLVCLTVSGWHNDIYFMKNMWEIEKIWSTTDDSSGEAFDKVAKMMWLSYPWWPIISELANKRPPLNPLLRKEGTSKKGLFPRVWLEKNKFDFSFSGLKSSVKREIDKRILENGNLSEEDKIEISYEFQEAITEVLAYKLINYAIKNNISNIALAWWVSANDKLKEKIINLSDKKLNFIYPVKKLYCMDNAAMVWILTYYRIKYSKFEEKIWSLEI